jgi:hypothetical protein
VLKKKVFGANFQRIIELFTQKIVTKLSKIWVWDPGSGIRDPEKTYSGSRGQKGTGSRIRNTAEMYSHNAEERNLRCGYLRTTEYGRLRAGPDHKMN